MIKRLLLALLLIAAVPVLTTCGDGDPTGPVDSATVLMSNNEFSRSTVRLNVNGTVTWRNNVTTEHNATSTTPPGVIDSGNLNRDETYTRTFNTAGTFDYRCTIHAGMNGRIIVQ